MSIQEQKSGRTGRPPKFERQKVVRQARDLFWRVGPDGVSYEDLTARTGLHRPSLCAAFGDKAGLFREGLEAYVDEGAAMLREALRIPGLRASLQAFFEADLRLFLGDGEGRGCYVLGIAAEAGREHPELAEVVAATWQRLCRAISDRVHRAHPVELPAGMRADHFADFVLATHVTLAVRGRAGEAREELQARVDRLLGLVGPEPVHHNPPNEVRPER